ncbi:hypothetical protein QA639_04990 [Bradyrhizobium pachyrhizi]|uniref:hypothetical protein n=1 Tax=Bradyrhizobium pachyrhizi TaxID=280333 RepID=UPI0024B18DB0|nr:hypothetical protein [Bradyrhizobium pachyrhizi]WFU56884.1 hypothetical protein QA639_04990 [Bradyrhizobium pachyrhizi]
MTEFCIQIHPRRGPQLDLAKVLSQFEHLSTDASWIRRRSTERGRDGHAYVNLTFETDYPKLFWQLLYEQFYQTTALGQFMRAASIVTCEGRRGWDDYLLLDHFDAGVTCDHFPE